MIAILTPSISYRLPTKQGLVFDAALLAPYRVDAKRPDYKVELQPAAGLGQMFTSRHSPE
jgi:hypothetical protein